MVYYIISALILLSNYLSGSLSILDIRMRLDGYKFANEESITVKPYLFLATNARTFTPSAEILKRIKSRIARNGSSTIKKLVDDNGVSREIPVSYQEEGNTFKMQAAWVMLPTSSIIQIRECTACVVKQTSFCRLAFACRFSFFRCIFFGVTFIEVVAEFDSGIFQRLKEWLGMSREISLMQENINLLFKTW